MADDTPSVFVTARSTCCTIVVVSVAWLFAGVGSIEPAGIDTVAVFDNVPAVADAVTVPVTVKVAVPDDVSVTRSATLPEPLPLAQLEPAEAVHVQIAPTRAAGSGSLTEALVMVDGPAFVTTIVYVSASPAAIEVSPSVLVMIKSAVGVTDVVSVAVLLPDAVSVTPAGASIVAVLAITPAAEATTVAVTTIVAVPPGFNDTVVLIALPAPEAGHVEPTDAEHVQETPPSEAGAVSVNGASGAADGPRFDTTIW